MLQRIFVGLATIILGAQLFAQSEAGTGTINGAISDPSGAAIASAKVRATNQATGLTREAETTGSGDYTLVRLPSGIYDIKVEVQGFKIASRPNVPVNVGTVATVDLTLQVGTASETITVSDEVPVVETTRSQTSTLVGEKLIRDLPINGRNFLDFVTLTPGVVRDPRGGDLSFAGQKGTVNSFLIDGADANNNFFGQSLGRQGVRNPYAVSQDAVQEFQVNTNGFAPELGRAAGGVINVITKSGTNDLHGGLFFFYRDTNLNANNSINKTQRRTRAPYKFRQFGGNVGGAIVKDKLFYFVNYDGQRNNEAVVMTTAAVRPTDPVLGAAYDALVGRYGNYNRGLNNDVLLGKIDYQLSSRDTINFRYNGNRFTGTNYENAGAQRLPESTGDSKVNTDTIGGTYTRVFGPREVADFRFTYVRDDEPGQANSTAPETTILQGGQTVLVSGRNNFSPRYTNLKRYQFASSLTSVRGRHTIKFGGDLNIERISNFFPGQFSGVYQFNSIANWVARTPDVFSQALPGAGTNGPLSTPNLREIALFIQDQWRVTDRLTLNYGLRYDINRTDAPPVANPNAQLAATGLSTKGLSDDNNNWGPRFGFAYRLLKSDRIVLRGGYGLFYARTPAILTGTVHTQNGIQVQNYSFTGSNIPVTFPNILSAPPAVNRTPNIFVFEKGYQLPETQQWSFNVEARIAPDTSVTVGYLGVRGLHLTRSRDINLFPAAVTTGTLSTGGTISFLRYPTARPNTSFGRITLVESGADSYYHGGFIQVSKRYARNLIVQGSYTYSKVIDTAPDATAVLPNNGGDDTKIAQFTTQPNLDRGLGDANTPHRFVASGVWDISYFNKLSNLPARYLLGGWNISLILQANTGRPYSARVSAFDLNNDGNRNSDRVPGLSRNTLTLPTFGSADLRVSKDIPLVTERVKLKLIGEAFNFTNRTNITGKNANRYAVTQSGTNFNFTPVAAFGANTAAGDPRILQLALKLNF